MKKLLLLIALALAFTGCEKEEVKETPITSLEDKYSNVWTIEMAVSDVTPTGLKGKITHSGDRVWATTGARYVIEKLEDGEWTDAGALCEIYWNAIGYIIPDNDSYEFEVGWENIYGALPSGRYRIGKEVGVKGTRLNEYEGIQRIEHFNEDTMYYSEFDI